MFLIEFDFLKLYNKQNLIKPILFTFIYKEKVTACVE